MNREIKIVKRAVRDLTQVEQDRDKARVDAPGQMARTIQKWVKERRQRAMEELIAARSLKTALS